jgi:hypothetical protein
LLHNPGDLDCLTKDLEMLMGSETERETLMKKARERLLRLFVWERYFDRVEYTFRGILET